jgi:CubicO group peptidase (beta-lactamase class C family)
MSACESIDRFLQSRIAAGDFPSAVYTITEDNETKFQNALGDASVIPERVKASTETVYDLASLTKVLVTATLIAKLVEARELSLDDSLGRFISEAKGTDKATLTIRQLLTHTSGFKAWLPFYALLGGSVEPNDRLDSVIRRIVEEPFENQPNSKVVYSDLNFLVLGALIERTMGMRLDAIALEAIFTPLGLKYTGFNPTLSASMIAACEEGNGHERRICVDAGYDDSAIVWRKDVIRGQVHDGNCMYLGGVAGHAGLFANVREVGILGNQFIRELSTLFSSETCAFFSINMTSQLNEHRSFGFQIASSPDSTASNRLSQRSFGHLGFTGTSLWVDPDRRRVFTLLTNRTHAHELPFVNINSVRREFNRLAAESLQD